MISQFRAMGNFHSHPETTLYLTLVFELRGDTDQYMYSIDRCYTSLARANDRLKLLSRCNTDTTLRETISAGLDPETGCHWCTWARPGTNAGRFRFYAEVKQVVMQGSVRRDGPSKAEQAAIGGGLLSVAERKYSLEHKKDLAGHIWVVALHFPDRQIHVSQETGKPTSLPWVLESVHEASGNAMGRAKRLWRDEMMQIEGPFDRLDLHYGFARYLLVPLRASMGLSGKRLSIGGVQRSLVWNATAQIRVERIKVIDEGAEMLAMFAPAQAILYDKPFRPLRDKSVLDEGERGTDVRAELLDLFDAAGERPEDLLFGGQAVDLSSLLPPPAMREVSLMSLQEAYRPPIGREDEEQVDDVSSLAPSSIRRERRASLSSSQSTFRPGVEQEYSQLATMLRDPVPARNRLRKTPRNVADDSAGTSRKSMAGIGKHLYNSMVRENSRNKLGEAGIDERDFVQAKKKKKYNKQETEQDKKKHRREPTIYNTDRVPLETPGQVALAAHQTLLMASMLSRG